MPPENVKFLPENTRMNQEMIQKSINLGCTKAKVISTKTISIAHWMKLQCQYGCSRYGSLLTCPPFTPDAEEMAEVIPEYDTALLINASPDTHISQIGIHLEKYLKAKGFNRAFALFAQPCNLCTPCTITTNCQYPDKARPTLQACGIDVNETIHNNGWDDLGPQIPCTENHSIGMVLLG